MSAAAISPCGRYRFALEREWAPGPALAWLMLNPSTADATVDDPTIRKVRGFSKANGYGAAMVVNLFAHRATDPRDVLRNLADAEGEQNCAAIMQAASIADTVVCAWGATPWAREQAGIVLDWLLDHPERTPRLVCLGTTKDGSPRHPLYVPYSQAFVPFDAEGFSRRAIAAGKDGG